MGYIYSQNRNIGSQYLTDNRVYGLSFSTPNISKKQGTIAIKPFYANFKFFEWELLGFRKINSRKIVFFSHYTDCLWEIMKYEQYIMRLLN